MITSTGAEFWLRFCLSVLVLVIFCVVYLETADCAQWRSRQNEQARQMDAAMLYTQSLFCTLTLEPNRPSHQSHALDPSIKGVSPP